MALKKPPPKKSGAGGNPTSSSARPIGSLRPASSKSAQAHFRKSGRPGAAGGVNPLSKTQGGRPASSQRVGISPGSVRRQFPVGSSTAAAAALQKKDEPIEKAVLELPWMADVVESPMFRRFMDDVAPRMTLPKTSLSILESFSSKDVKAEKVGHALEANQYYEHQFLRVIESLSKRELPAINSAVVLLGMQRSRDLIMALQMRRLIRGVHPEWDDKGKLLINPQEVLNYALKTEEELTEAKSEYADMAYSAGMMFDYLASMADELAEDSKKARAYIEGLYNHGMRTARLGVKIVERAAKVNMEKYVFGACLIHDVGKAVMAILNSEYLDFLEANDKKGLPRQVRQFAEIRRFGISHALLGALCCHCFQFFKPIEKAILFHHDPYLLKGNKSLYDLSALICLSTNVANNFRKIELTTDPVVKLWMGTELQDFKINVKDLINVVAEAISEGNL